VKQFSESKANQIALISEKWRDNIIWKVILICHWYCKATYNLGQIFFSKVTYNLGRREYE